MPLIEVIVPEGAIPADRKDEFAERMTVALLAAEGAPDNAATRAISWLYLDERPATNVFQGGAPAIAPTVRVRVTVPAGAIENPQRESIVRDLTDIVLDVLGDRDAGFRVWVMIDEVKDGNWGGAGRVFRLKDIARLARAGEMQEAQPAPA